jgi:hypothetical protein
LAVPASWNDQLFGNHDRHELQECVHARPSSQAGGTPPEGIVEAKVIFLSLLWRGIEYQSKTGLYPY